jgi:hypothetical protein
MAVRARSRRLRPAADATRDHGALHTLFAWGRLADAHFVARLLERPVAADSAELLDFELLASGGAETASLFAAAGARTAGKLYRGISSEDFLRLDAYHGVAEDLFFRDLGRVVRPGAAAAKAEEAWIYLPTARTVGRFPCAAGGPRRPRPS